MMRSVASTTVLQIVALLVSLGDRVLLTALLLRAWGVHIFEDWAIIFAAASLFALLDAGLHMTFSNGFTQARQGSDEALYQRRVGAALFVLALVMIVGLLLLAALAFRPNWTQVVTATYLEGGDGRFVFVALSVAIILQTVSSISTAVYRANDLFSRSLALDIAFTAGRAASIALVALSGRGPVLAAGVYCVQTVLWVLIVLPWDQAHRLRLVKYNVMVPTWTELKAIASQSSLFCVQQTTQILLQSTPLLLLSRVPDATGKVAAFVLLRTLFNSARQLLFALSNAVGIELAQIHWSLGDGAEVRSQVVRFTRLIALLNSAALGLLLTLAEPIFQLWTGGKVLLDREMVLIFVAGYMVSGPFVVVSIYWNYIGKAGVGATSRLLTAGIALVVALALIRSQGVLGVVIGLAAGEAIGSGLAYLPSLARASGVAPGFLAISLAGFTSIGFVPVLVVDALVPTGAITSGFETLALRAMILAPVALGLVLLFGMSREDRGAVWQITRRRTQQLLAR